MTKQKALTSFVSTLLTLLAVLGGLGCLATGMELRYDLQNLIWGCLLLALVFSLFWDTRLWLLPLCLSALLLGYWWQEGTLRLSMESLLYHITDLYDRGYGWGILQWSDRGLLNRDMTPALLAFGLPIAGVVSLTITKGRFGWAGCILAVLPLSACALLKDTVPAAEYLGLLLFAVTMILLTAPVRCNSHKQADTLTLTLLLPLTLAIALLFTFCPKDTYAMQDGAQKLEDLVLQILEKSKAPEGPTLIPGDQARVVDLAAVGQREKDKQTIMTVKATETGTLYLRGCAYDVYDGKSWSSTPGWNSWNLFYNNLANDDKVYSAEIETRQTHSVLYFAYNPIDPEQKVVGGRMRNEEGLTEYLIRYKKPITYDSSWDERDEQIGGAQLSEYLQLPGSTRQKALQILTTRVGIPTETINAGQVWRNANYIVDWVSHRGTYDLNTPKMPADADDFALWFLEESKTGYCTHYATAAVVLLRAAGIPAQYVTGYMVSARRARAVPVMQSNAHAWVEVFINGVGWVMLEPTPAARTQLPDYLDSVIEPTVDIPEPTVAPTTQTTEPTSMEIDPQPTTEPEESVYHPTATVPPTTGVSTIGGANPGTPSRQAFGNTLVWMLMSICALLALLIQWRIRVAWYNRRKKDPNAQALILWRQLERACRAAKLTPPEEMLTLAQKARFSQHRLTAQELHQMQIALRTVHKRLRKKNIFSQLVYTLVLAIY